MQEYQLTHSGNKPKKKSVERALKRKDPKIIENTKNALILYGKNTSQIIKNVLGDFYAIKKPFITKFERKNDIYPFEDASSIEFFAKKEDISLFAFGNHTKKRPNNLIIGRLFNHVLLDMVEFGVEDYKEMQKSSTKQNMVGSKPLLLFNGDLFNNDDTLKEVQNVLIDFFNGEKASKVNLKGLDHVLVFTSLSENLISFGHYFVEQIPSTKAPKINLTEIGPSMNLKVKRTKFASQDLRKEAYFIPQELRKSKTRNKNISFDELGSKEGRIHVRQENLSGMAIRRFDTTKKELPTQMSTKRDITETESFDQAEERLRKKKKE